VVRRAGALVALAACADGPAPETVIDELRLVTVVAEPPEVRPGEVYALDVVVADPVGDGFELQVFQCGAAGCALQDPAAVVAEAGVQWTFACAPGLCDPTEADLADPVAWLAELPLEGVSAASRAVRVAETPALANPVITSAPTSPGRRLSFVVPGATIAYGQATSGGFARASVDVASDGSVTLERIPGEQAGTAWVVFEGEPGARTYWTAAVEGAP
jgi:hypothetical protein